MRLRALFAMVLLIASTACTVGVKHGTDPARVDGRLQALLDSAFDSSDGVPGAMLLVDAPEQGVWWDAAVGVSDPGSGAALSVAQPLRLASITKTYVAAAVLRLYENGDVALDESIARHLLPETVRTLRSGGYDLSAITPRLLLQHTSGLADYATTAAFLARVFENPSHRWTRAEQLRLAMDVGAPLADPGTEFHYSDTGYLLLGELLEQVTGGPLHTALRRLLSFDALGLDATWLESFEPAPPGLPARAHQFMDSIDTWSFDPSLDLFGGGGLVAPLGEAGDFIRALFAGEVLRDPGTLAVMTATTPLSLPATEGGYGMGIARVRHAGLDCFGHGGFWGTVVRYCPAADVLVAGAVTSTAGRDMLDGLVRRALALVLDARSTAPDVASHLGVGIPDRVRADGVPGLNILVIREGEVVRTASYGWSDGADAPGRPSTCLFARAGRLPERAGDPPVTPLSAYLPTPLPYRTTEEPSILSPRTKKRPSMRRASGSPDSGGASSGAGRCAWMCRCGSVEAPELPTSPSRSPTSIESPGLTATLPRRMCASTISAEPQRRMTWLPSRLTWSFWGTW